MTTQKKWYNDLQTVGTLLLFWPPLELYGVVKSNKIETKWKNLVYGNFTLVLVLLAIVQLS